MLFSMKTKMKGRVFSTSYTQNPAGFGQDANITYLYCHIYLLSSDMENELQKKTYERITGELSRFLPLGYLAMVIIGMIFNYFRYEAFGLNIFQYASVFDFLISPFEDMHILLFIFGSMLLVLFTVKMDKLWKKHFPNSYKKWSFKWTERSWYKPASYIFVITAYIFYGAYFYGVYTYNAVPQKKDITVRYQNNETLTGKQIGKVGNALFLLCGEKVKIIPATAYKELSYPLGK